MTWLLSAITVTVMWLAGNKNPLAWKLSLANQCLWLAWIIHERHWGLLPMNLAMFIVASRNIAAWNRRTPQTGEACPAINDRQEER